MDHPNDLILQKFHPVRCHCVVKQAKLSNKRYASCTCQQTAEKNRVTEGLGPWHTIQVKEAFIETRFHFSYQLGDMHTTARETSAC